MTDRELMQMALDALEGALSDDQPYIEKSKKAAEALRQALAQPEQESFIVDRWCWERGCMAYDWRDKDGVEACVDAVNMTQERVDETAKREPEPVAHTGNGTAGRENMTAPTGFFFQMPKREWVGLTDADKQEAFDETQEASGGFWEFADYLDAKLKEKNFG